MVGMARTAILANIAKFSNEGCYPVLVYHDDIAFFSRESDPQLAVPGILDRQRELGGFKHRYSLPVTTDLIATCDKAKPTTILTTMNSIAREKGLLHV